MVTTAGDDNNEVQPSANRPCPVSDATNGLTVGSLLKFFFALSAKGLLLMHSGFSCWKGRTIKATQI